MRVALREAVYTRSLQSLTSALGAADGIPYAWPELKEATRIRTLIVEQNRVRKELNDAMGLVRAGIDGQDPSLVYAQLYDLIMYGEWTG